MSVSTSSPGLPTDATRPAYADRAIAIWLLFTAGMVLAMAVIGAITRLTESGLSMVEWRPLIGTIPPLSDAEWQRVFDLYRQTPEYIHKNAGMGMDQFKLIFFWEWFHRLWGRLIGVVYALPFFFFLFTGRIRPEWRWPLFGLLILGGLQGVMGWFMVQSGLVDRPSVSHYRLAMHLGLAFVIFSLLIALSIRILGTAPGGTAPVGTRRLTWATLAVTAVTVTWGAFVAGLDAGLAYNTWPLMGGAFLPPESFTLNPAWVNAFENTALVQFTHRWLAILTAALVLGVAWQILRWPDSGRRLRIVAAHLAGMVVLQVALGIATLLLAVPIWLGALHQAGAFVLVGLLVWTLVELHPRRAPRLQAQEA